MRHSLNGRVRRIFTIVLTIIFLSQNIAWTAPSQAPLSISYQPSANLFIPEQYGRIDKSVNCKLSTVNSKSPTVILIKDAHCNYEAQTNISKILDILIRDYKIDLIGAEGASGYVNPSIVLESNPKEDVRKKVSDKFLRTGLLTASEALSINKGKEPGFTIWGVEDLKLYLRDFQAFRDSVGINNSAKHFIELLFNLIGQLKKKIYPEELLEFDDIIRKYQSNELPLTRFIKIVYYKYGIPRQHQNLKIVLKSMRLEEKIDFKKVEHERTQLIRQLEKTLPKEDLQELVKQSLLFKLGKIPAVEYYTYLNGQTINLKNYTRLVKLQSRIDESRLFNELEDLTEKIYAKLCKDKISHNLHLLDKDINILNKILSLEATRENLAYFKENYARFTPENLLRFIRIQAPLNNINLPPEISSPSFIEDAEKAVIPAEEFYRLAIERDNALVENLVQTMDKNKKDKAVLICGGFHADGIKKLLQDKGLSPITITPSITKIQEDSKELYLKRMMDERIDPEKLLKELGAENVSPTLATSRTGIKINLHEKIIASFKSYGYEIKQEFTQEEFRKLLPLLKELHNKALEDENESLKGFIENAVRQSGLEQKFQKLGGDSQEGKPKIFDPKFVRFTPQNLVLRLSNILGNSKELHRLRHVIPKLIKAKKEIRDAEEPSDITGGKAYPYNCQRCANRTAEILKRYGFHASIVDIKFAEKMSDKISHHAFVATRINDKDVIVDIAADEFELVEGKENEFLDLGVVILPLDYVKSNQERFWMYNPPVTQRSAESTAQEQQPDKQGGSESGNDTLHMKSMKLRKGSKYYADRLQINGQDVDINSIKGQISGITSWQVAPAMENEIDGMGITELESGGASIITVNGKRITIFKLIFSGKTFYITSDTITGFGPENFLNVINNALLALQGEGKDISHLPNDICIFNLSGSPHLFEDHTKNGFIGVNEALVNLYTNPSTTAEQKQLLSSLLQIGLEHELLHEMGITDESFIAQRDAKRIVEELYTKKGDIEKIKRLIALLEGDVEIEPDFKVELIIALIERHNRGRPIPNLRRNLNVSFDGDKTLKDYLLSFFENGFLLTIDPDDLRKTGVITIKDIGRTLDLLLKTARELPPWWVKGKDIVPLIIKFTQGEKLGKMGETRTTEKYYADIPEDIAVDCLADNPARTFLHELAHYRWRQMGNPGVMELQRCLHGLLATQDVPWEELNHESIAEVAATGGITSFLKRYKLTWLMAQESSSQRLELYGAVRLILITHLFRNPEPHPGYTNLHEYTWPYATDCGSIEIMKGWVRHNGEGNWEEVIDERFLSTPKAPESNDAIKKGRVPHKTVNRQIRKAILEGRAYKIWNRAVRPQKGDKEISVNTEEENYIEQCKRFLLPEYRGHLDTVDIVIIKDEDFLYFRNDNNHQSAHAGHRRRTCYLGEGLYNKIKNNPQTLAAAIAHEIFHITNPEGNENKAEAVEIRIDPERNLRKAIDELLSQGQSKEVKLKKFFSTSLPNFFMQVHFGSDNPQPLIDRIIAEAHKIDEQFATYIGRIAPLIARSSHSESRYEVERLCRELNDRYLLGQGFYIYTDSFMLHSEHYLKIRFYQLYKRPYSNSLPPQLSVLQDRVYLMERPDSLERLYSQNFFNHSTYLHQIGKGMIPSDELQDIADETLRIRRGGEYFTDSDYNYNGLGNLQTVLLRMDIGLEDISNIQREIENSFAIGECHLLQGQNEIPYSLTLPYELRSPLIRRYDDLLFIARIAFGNVPFIEIFRMLQYTQERHSRIPANNFYEPLSATYSFLLLARKWGFTYEKDQIRDWDVLRQIVERILALSTEELQRIAREIYEEELLSIRAQIPQTPTRTAPSLPPSDGLPSTVPKRGTEAVTIDMRGNVLEELPAPERETGIPQHLVPFTEREERGETEREPDETSTSPETPGVRYEYIYRYTKANRGEEYYLSQIRQARVQLERTTDIEERISIFLAVIWPQYLMALDDDSCGALIEEQVRETAEILNAEFGRQIARIIPLARELNNPTTAAGAKERIREIAAALRSNRFLIGHRFFLDTEVLERTNLQTHQTVWTLSSISYRIDSTNTYQVKFRGRNSTWIEIHFLGERVDRINQQREALGYTFLGDTFGVVVKKVVRDVVNMDIIPILNGVPFADAQVHPINETARRAVLRDGLPTHPAQTQLADIYEMFYRSTEIHELDHKIVECTERLAHLRNNPFEQRIRMEASAYLASIIDGPVPYSDLITILRLILGFRLALFDPYKPAGVLIFTEFARELGILDTVVDGIRIDEQNIRNGRLDTLNIILERLIKLNANRLRILAKKIRENILNIQTQPTQAQPPVPASVVGPQETATTTEARQQQEEPTIVPIVGDISTSSRFNFARIRIALFVIILALLAIFIHSDSIVTNYSHLVNSVPSIAGLVPSRVQEKQQEQASPRRAIEQSPELEYIVSYREYHVKPGESWRLLAKRFLGNEASWPILEYINGRPPTLLRNSTIKIPIYTLPDGKKFPIYVTIPHVVKPGESLSKIAQKYYGASNAWRRIHRDNPGIKDPNRIEKGQIIKIRFYVRKTGHTLKAPGSIGLDEDTGAKEYIGSIVNNPDNIAKTIQKENATIHTLNLGDKLGIPRFEGAVKPQDLVYAFGRKESDGKLHIYVTTAFWEILQENQLMLSFLTDHEYRENILGNSHAEASKKAWEFVDPDGMNPFYKFYLEQLADNGEEDELKRLVLSEEHRDRYGLRFKQYARKLLLGKRCISEIGIINELLKNDEGKTPGITNLYASHNIGAKVVIDTFSNLGEEINTFFNSERENGLNISREEINIQGRLNIMSNIRKALQGEGVRISEDDWEQYTRFNDAKADGIDFSGTDVVILHDHEFLGMVPNLKKMGKKVIWHCHLDLDNFNPDVWDRLRGYVNKCDPVILQPRDKYENIYKTLGITTPAVFAPPATLDPTSNKHRQLDKAEEEQIKSSLDIENLETTPYFLYTGRLDPQKGIMDMIRAFKKMYENLPEGQRAKLIIVSTPEDEDTPYYREIYGYIQGLKDSSTRGFEDIHILFLRPDDAGTDITINYLQRNALSGLQLSSREGFGLPMAEMMYKGRPVIGTDVGGIRTQIRHALTGYLVKPGSQLVENAAGYMTKLVLDRKEAERLGMKAKELASGNYLASNLVLNYLTAVYSVLKNVAKPMEAMSIPKFLAHTKSINIFDAVNTLEQEFYKLLEELEGPGINDEQREQTLRAIGNIMEYFEAIEHTIYDMFTSGGRASFLVLERLKNIFWKLYRENNWSTPVDVLCINLPVGAINTRAGMEMADDLKERFFEVVKKYMKEKKKEGILRYEKVSSGYYGIGKTQMYIIGLGAEDIPEIKRLYEEALMAIGIYKTEDFPIYIGHKRASLKGYKRQLGKSKSGERDKYLENLVIDTMQEALGMAEFIEKKWRISNKYSLSSGDWIMRVPGIRKIVRRLGRKKFIPENEYETNRLPRIRHMLGFLSVKRKSILSNTPRKAHAIFYVNNLRGILLKSLKDVRYRGTYKREYIDGVVEQMKKDNSFFTFLDWTMEKAVMTRAGDEMWFYVKTDKGIESFFGELNKFNAFNDAYEPDSADSFYHQIIKWLKLNMPEIHKFYKKLYEEPSSITLDDIANFNQLTKFLEQIGYDAGKVLEIFHNPRDERRAGLIEKIKSINVIKYVDIKVSDAPPYNSRKGYTAYTEAARVKGKWFKIKLVKSKPLVTIKSRERKKIWELPFHSSDKLRIDGKIHRLKLYVIKNKNGEIIRRFVVHNYRIYTADGKGQDDEEDITDSVLSHRDEYEFEPDVTTLGVTLTFDRANLLNLRGDFDESNAHQKKYMHALVSDVSENTANQIISIIKTNYNPGFSISQSDLAETIIQSSKGTYNINFMNLWDLLKQKGVPEDKFFEIAVSLSNPINDLLGSDARSKGGLVISAVLREILKSLPAAEREIIVNEQKTPEEQLLETLKHIAKKKGIDLNAIQSIFDLFKGGIDILTMDPALDPRQIDGSYFTLIQQLCELTGISESAIMNAFKDNFGINFRITQGKIIPDSILWKETQRLMEYNRKYTGDYPLAGVNTELWDSDFHSGRVVDKAENRRNLYLSALDAVTKDVKAINSALRETPARNTVESRDPVGVIYHINDYIKYDKKTGSFSFRPGAESIIKQMGGGINIVFTTEDVPEDELMFYKQALKATERLDKSIFIANTLEDAHNLIINKGIDKAEGRIVYVTKTEQNAIKARKLGIKSIIAEEVEGVFAFHATLIFAVLYARAKPNEVKTLIWHFLKLMGYKDDKIAEVISDLKKHGFFTVRLIRIADTLREFQNRKIFIDAAA